MGTKELRNAMLVAIATGNMLKRSYILLENKYAKELLILLQQKLMEEEKNGNAN